jgi:hypothetical protein
MAAKASENEEFALLPKPAGETATILLPAPVRL